MKISNEQIEKLLIAQQNVQPKITILFIRKNRGFLFYSKEGQFSKIEQTEWQFINSAIPKVIYA